jgi:hypothetical protein
MARYIDADKLKDRMFSYYECVNADTSKSNYRGETLMNYEVADMIEDCIDNAPDEDVVPRAELAVRSFQDAATIYDLQKKLVVATEVLKHILSGLKKEIHDKAVYPNVNGVEPYIPVARVDALIQSYIDKVKEGK